MNPELQGLLGSIDPEELLPPEQVAELLKTGQKDQKLARYDQAIEKLELLCRGVEPGHRSLDEAHMSLVKAYQGAEKIELAIELCRYLTAHDKDPC